MEILKIAVSHLHVQEIILLDVIYLFSLCLLSVWCSDQFPLHLC